MPPVTKFLRRRGRGRFSASGPRTLKKAERVLVFRLLADLRPHDRAGFLGELPGQLVQRWANLLGVFLPMILTKFGADPAIASSPLITSLAARFLGLF